MDHVLQDFDYCLVYEDDILITSETVEDNMAHLKAIFDRLRKYYLMVNMLKCTFAFEGLKFVGHSIVRNGTKHSPEKIDATENYPKPLTVCELQRFLDILNFYWRFLPHAAEKLLTLNNTLGFRSL